MICYLETKAVFCYTYFMFNEKFKRELTELGAKENVPLSSLSTFRIGGPAAFFLEATNADMIKKAYFICRDAHCPLAFIGNGSNIICPDKGFEGVIIKIKKSNSLPVLENNFMKVFSGDLLTQIALYSVKKGYSGFERLAGIPGTVGGAIAMNAGAYGGEIKDVLYRVHILTQDSEYWTLASPDMFGYRKSPFKWPSSIVTEAIFRLESGNGAEKEIMEDCLCRRKEKQPLEYPSAGSVFKRPEGFFAGKLIEDAGLKGYRIGGAEVSTKHAGFIINRGGATEADVMNLIDFIQSRILSQFGVFLEREVIRLGEISCIF